MAHGFNIVVAIKLIINKMLSIIILLILYTDLKLLFNYLVRLSTIQEKHLIINIICLCQAYKRREIAEIKWINSNANPANIIKIGRAHV